MENEIIEWFKLAATLFTCGVTLVVWRDQKRLQEKVIELNAKNNLELKEREFELKFFEEIIKNRLAEYNKAKKQISELLNDFNPTIESLQKTIEILLSDTNNMLSLDYKTGQACIKAKTEMMRILIEAKTSSDGDNSIAQNAIRIRSCLLEMQLEINHGLLSLNNLDLLKKDNQKMLLNLKAIQLASQSQLSSSDLTE